MQAWKARQISHHQPDTIQLNTRLARILILATKPVSCLFSGCRHLATFVVYLGLKRYSTPTQPIRADKLIRYLCWYETIPQSAKSPEAPILDNIHTTYISRKSIAVPSADWATISNRLGITIKRVAGQYSVQLNSFLFPV